MNKIIFFILVIIVTIINTSFSQMNPNIPKFNYEGYSFEGYVYRNFKDSLLVGLNDECIDSYGSAKFSFDVNGNVTNIVFSSGTPKIIAKRLEIVIKKSNDFWDKESIAKINNPKKEYLLPFHANYTLGKNCLSSFQIDSKNVDKFDENQAKVQLSFVYMYDFEKGRNLNEPAGWYKSMSYSKFDGVIFRPILFRSPQH